MVGEKNTRVLVIGGAGYIGSHVAKDLLDSQYHVAVYDNLLTGRKQNIPTGAQFYKASILNKKALLGAFEDFKPHAVVHLAAEKSVGKSMVDANAFSDTNIIGTINILQSMHQCGTNHIVFSSSAAVFGAPQYLPIDEKHPQNPINYYGATKKIMEEILHWYDVVYGIRYSALRYFNAAGHTPQEDMVIVEKNAQNLIPIILETAQKKRDVFQIFGKNYKTVDGTCIRDYIHVCDLADAHVKSITYLQEKNSSITLNLGTGRGFSVKQVYDAACKVTNIDIPVKFAKPRAEDPSELYAKANKAQRVLGWKPQYKKLEEIISHMWQSYERMKAR